MSQILFSMKSKKNIISLSSAETTHSLVRVKDNFSNFWVDCLESILSIHTLKFSSLKMPRKTASENVNCLCHLLHFLANFSNILFAYKQNVWNFLHIGKKYGCRSDCSYRSSLILVHLVCKNDF